MTNYTELDKLFDDEDEELDEEIDDILDDKVEDVEDVDMVLKELSDEVGIAKPATAPPTFPVDDAWYSLSEVRNLIAKPMEKKPKPELEAKKKSDLTCDLTFHDVLDNKKKLSIDSMLQLADALGYKYFVADNKVYEIKYEGDVTGAVDTGLTLEDINEIL